MRRVKRATVPWGRLVLDEAQQVKNPGTAQTRAIIRIEAGRRIALTGTPVENRLSELWSLMTVLNPEVLGSAAAFKRRFAVPTEAEADAGAAHLLRRTGPTRRPACEFRRVRATRGYGERVTQTGPFTSADFEVLDRLVIDRWTEGVDRDWTARH